MNIISYLLIVTAALAANGCDQGGATSAPSSSPAKDGDSAASKADSKPAEKAAPSCDVVVDNIASFNPGSGDSERKLWNKMCAEMDDAQRSCVAVAKDMAGMKSCVTDKKLTH